MSIRAESYRQVAVQNRRDALILDHLALVRHVVGKLIAHLPPGLDLENLESAGMLGLVEAATNFDASRGVEFKSFAIARIRGAALDELRRNCPLPQHVLERVAKLRRAYQKLEEPVTVETLAEATGLSHDEVLDTLAAIRLTQMVSWERTGEPILTRLDDRQEQPQSEFEREERKRTLAEAIASLPERERLVVTLYYMENLRLKEIGQVLKLSESRVSRVLNAALFQLGEYLRARDM
jgi:RNA polymerase sigma factor for flagellar operon FliA